MRSSISVRDRGRAAARAVRPLILVLPLALGACDGGGGASDEPTRLSLAVDPRVGAVALSTNPATLYDIGGARSTVTGARLYVSAITLLKADGTELKLTMPAESLPVRDASGATSTVSIDERIVLVRSDAGETTTALGDVPAGRYTGLRYTLGISGAANHVDATQAPAGHPLAKRTDLNNHWSWNSGFIHTRLDGRLDLDRNGAPDTAKAAAWQLHLGTDAYTTVVTSTTPFTLSGGRAQALVLTADYGRVMQGIDLNDPAKRLCHTMDNLPVATAAKANMAAAVTFAGVR